MSQSMSCAASWVIVFVVVVVFAAPAAADVSVEQDNSYNRIEGVQQEIIDIDQEASYDGIEGENEQMIRINITISSQVPTENLSINIQEESSNVLIDEATLNSPNPGVEQPLSSQFKVDQLGQGESIIITFEAYPKSLQEADVVVGTIIWSSDQKPDAGTEEINANLSSSPLIQLEQAEQRIDELEGETESLESEIDGTEMWKTVGPLAAVGGFIIAVGSIIGALFLYKRRINSLQESTFERLTSTLRKIKNQQKEHMDYAAGRDDAFDILKTQLDTLGNEWGLGTPDIGDTGGFDPTEGGSSSGSTGGSLGDEDESQLGSDSESSLGSGLGSDGDS